MIIAATCRIDDMPIRLRHDMLPPLRAYVTRCRYFRCLMLIIDCYAADDAAFYAIRYAADIR